MFEKNEPLLHTAKGQMLIRSNAAVEANSFTFRLGKSFCAAAAGWWLLVVIIMICLFFFIFSLLVVSSDSDWELIGDLVVALVTAACLFLLTGAFLTGCLAGFYRTRIRFRTGGDSRRKWQLGLTLGDIKRQTFIRFSCACLLKRSRRNALLNE